MAIEETEGSRSPEELRETSWSNFFVPGSSNGTDQDVDWHANKDVWVRSVESLYDFVEEMLRVSIAAKDVTGRRLDTQVTEDFIGTYSIPVLEMNIANERVQFRPKGITVNGASGRVDIRGEGDTVTLLRDQPDATSGYRRSSTCAKS